MKFDFCFNFKNKNIVIVNKKLITQLKIFIFIQTFKLT